MNTKRFLHCLLFALLPGLTWGGDDYLSPAISPAQLAAMLGSPQAPLIVDLRTAAEFKVGHIPGAVNIPLPQLEQRLDEIQHTNGVLIYCINGSRTRQAEPLLFAHDIPDIRHLDGAFYAWIQGDYPRAEGVVSESAW